MKRAQKVALNILAFLAAWATLYFGLLDKQIVSAVGKPTADKITEAVTPLPAYALIVLGCYALYSVGSALWSYRDCDDAAKSLQTDIKEAREALKKKGYKL